MLTVAVSRFGTKDTLGEVLESRTEKISRFSGRPSCWIVMGVQNSSPGALLVPTGRVTTSLIRATKSAGAGRRQKSIKITSYDFIISCTYKSQSQFGC